MLTQGRDSIFIHDSVFVRVGGDTVVRERWRTVWRDRAVHDTVRIYAMDTIVKTETVEKTVEAAHKGGNAGWAVAAALFLLMAVYMLIKHLL